MKNDRWVMDILFDETKNIAYIKITGLVSSKEILEAFDIAVSSEKYKTGMEGYGILPRRTCLQLILIPSVKWHSTHFRFHRV